MKTRTYHLDPSPWSCHFVAALPLCVPVPQTDWEPACCSAWSEESGRAVLCEPDAQRCFWNCALNQLSPRQSCNRNKLVSALWQHFSWRLLFVSQMLRNVSETGSEPIITKGKLQQKEMSQCNALTLPTAALWELEAWRCFQSDIPRPCHWNKAAKQHKTCNLAP